MCTVTKFTLVAQNASFLYQAEHGTTLNQRSKLCEKIESGLLHRKRFISHYYSGNLGWCAGSCYNYKLCRSQTNATGSPLRTNF